MLIYKNKILNITYVYIHIPKNSGKHIREQIYNDKNNEIIRWFWDCDSTFDYAHIPYLKRDKFIDNNIDYIYFAHSRNPYDRIISAFFYLNSNKKIDDFKSFCKNKLIHYDFHLNYDKNYIHYYPQYLFLCDEHFNITHVNMKKLEDECKDVKKYNLIEYFDDECIAIINEIYKKDFELFGYEIITKKNG